MVQVVGGFESDEVPDGLTPPFRMRSIACIPRSRRQGTEEREVRETQSLEAADGRAPGDDLIAGLQTANLAGNQQEPKADNPGPGCDWLADVGNLKVRRERNHKQDKRDDPNHHCRSLTRIAHWLASLPLSYRV